MARRHTIGLTRRVTAASLMSLIPAAAVLLGLVPLIAYALQQGGAVAFDGYIWSVLRFTLTQAALSTSLSILPAIFVARALVRQEFPGKAALLALFAVPLALPVIVAVLGITAVYGNAGWLGGWFDLYGLTGILIAHVFFNLPLATRILYESLQSIPAETHRLAAQLDVSGWAFFRTVEWPYLKPAIASAAALIFLLCAASFVVVLTLGGGPSATTLEVAIYQSLRLDFDLARAVTLSFLQIVLCAGLGLLISQSQFTEASAPLRMRTMRFDGKHLKGRIVDAVVIAIAAFVVIPPLMAIAAVGLGGLQYTEQLPVAFATSIALGLTAAVLTVAFAWIMARADVQTPRFGSFLSVMVLAGLIVPPAVIATGWFIAFRGWSGNFALALAMIVALNALIALPFASSILRPAVMRHAAAHDRLCAQLGVSGWNRLRLIDSPALRQPLAQALLMAFVLSLGDLTAVTLLGTQGIITLPSLVAQQMGNYRSTAAGGTALLLAVLCYGLTLAAHRLGRSRTS
jgi:thiamine transport system permease protein